MRLPALAWTFLVALLPAAWELDGAQAAQNQEAMIVESEGRAGVFRLGTPIWQYQRYLEPGGQPKVFRSHSFQFQTDAAGRITRITTRQWGMFTQRFIRIGQSTLQEVLVRYGDPNQIITEEGNLVFVYRGLSFRFAARGGAPLKSREGFDAQLKSPVEAVSIFNFEHFEQPSREDFTQAASYRGDCRARPAGTMCVGFRDGYVALVKDEAILGWHEAPPYYRETVEVAVGRRAEYHHVLNTKLFKVVPLEADFRPQPSYSGDCRYLKPGLMCVGFDDGYVSLVRDKQIAEFREAPPNRGRRVQIAIGARAEYQHVLGTDLFREVPK